MSRSTRTLAAIAVSAIVATSFAACGSDSKDDQGSGPSTLSATDFKEQANALCKTANAEIKTIQDSLASATTEDAATTIVAQMTDRITELVDGIKGLKEPSDLSAGVEEMLGDVSSVVDDIKSQGLAYFTNLKADPFEAADAKANAIGLPECAGND